MVYEGYQKYVFKDIWSKDQWADENVASKFPDGIISIYLVNEFLTKEWTYCENVSSRDRLKIDVSYEVVWQNPFLCFRSMHIAKPKVLNDVLKM